MSSQQQKVAVNTETVSLFNWLQLNINVVAKLIFFTVALFAAPLLTFFYSVEHVFDGNTTYAAGSAALIANLIVIAYVITAFFEKPNDEKEAKKE
ncbi:hypothetical protein BDB01DRAFT_780699 [Pilobolus umbonatus]|nr:hypothetical protein BDB01DRAFT_780699 [Pilobolus umbonatus]